MCMDSLHYNELWSHQNPKYALCVFTKYSVAAVDCDILKHAQNFSLLHSITLESLDMIYTYGTRLKLCVHYNSIKLFSSDSKSNGNIYSRKRFRMWSRYLVAKLLLYFNTFSAMPSWVYCEYHCMQYDCYEGLFFFLIKNIVHGSKYYCWVWRGPL